MTTNPPSLRERKKQATREALRSAALRMALERGPENVRVDDIADAAGVSPRTYNNYFSSREQAIIAAVVAERETRIAEAVSVGSVDVDLAEAITGAVVEQYTDPGDRAREVLLMITGSASLRASYLDTVTAIEEPLAIAIAERAPGVDPLAARVLAASVGAAVKIALQEWLQSTSAIPSISGFIVPSGSLSERIRASLTPLAPSFDSIDGSRREA